MLFDFFVRKKNNKLIFDRQYAALTSVARQPTFYTQLSVPDTVMGRFELLSIVMILYFRRTRLSGKSGQQIAQTVVEAFFQDLDHSIRELGIGDHGVPKRMKKFAGMFYGRLKAYADAMDSDDQQTLEDALGRNIFPEMESDLPDMSGLANWMITAENDLKTQSEELIVSGNLTLLLP